EGNLYLDSTIIVDMAYKVLNAGFPTDTVRRGQIKLAGNELVMKDKILEADGTAIYLKAYREAEKEAAYHLVRLLRSPGNTYNIERELEAVLAKSKMTLAQKQEEAVRMVFRSQVSIITGGPGKGKTTILK
ncbi:ATP-dependent RecD-like DNA helicase, partial [Anaerotignum faecicola]|nr:ATP-dependent RecD-like DNA helicase [Anaerotignum faecicola]